MRGEWWFEEIRLAAAWDGLRQDRDVTVAVADTGVHGAHSYLEQRLCDGYDFVVGSAAVHAAPGRHHGTGVAGIIAQVTAANPRIRIMPLTTRHEGAESVARFVSALDFAIERGVQVLSVSYRVADAASPVLETALRRAFARGLIVVVSAGNENADLTRWPMFPATLGLSLPGVITVQAVGPPGQYFLDSNFAASQPLLAAPGVGVRTTTNDGWTNMHATSAAAPIVAGSIALLLSDARFARHARSLKTLLVQTARPYAQRCPRRPHQEAMHLLDHEALLRA